MSRGPQQLTFGPHAARQVADAVKRVERASRSQRPHRRRTPPRGGTPSTVRKVTFVLPMALVSQLTVSACPVLNDWYSTAGATSIDAFNEAGWQGDAGAEGYAEYRPSDQKWVITLLPCPQGSS